MRYGKTSNSILERNFGKQIGHTSKTGLRGFAGVWSDGSYRIEVIDKDFNRRSNTIIDRNKNGVLNSVQRTLFGDGKVINTRLSKYLNPFNLFGGPKQDVKYVHHISECGVGIKQRVGQWSTFLPSGKKFIDRNDGHILDYLIK